jgi:dUTP pyrophosphatase
MQAKIVRLDPEIPLPKYATSESTAFDICAGENALVQPGEVKLIKSGLIIQGPPGHFLLLAARSSLPVKKGLMLANGIGIVDRDFAGPNDEIKIQLFNFTKEAVAVKKGERLAQGLFLPVEQVEWAQVDGIVLESRGGHGSSGGYAGEEAK